MPKWVQTFFALLLIFGLIGALVFVGYAVITMKNGGALLDPNQGPAPTVDAEALAKYTPTPGPSSAQMATAVILAKPTPYVEWSPGDAKIMIDALRDKAIVSEQDINIAAQLSSPGEGHVCIDLKTIFDIKLDEYCKVSLTWTEWALAYKPQNIEVQVKDSEQHDSILSEDGTHYVERPYADVTIIITDLGIVGPTTRFDQSYDFYKDVNSVWKLAIDLKEIIFGDDLRNKANELTADADDLALADSLAPLQENGLRSPEYTDQLYATFVANLTTQGQGHIYNRLYDYATLVANNREDGKDAGYAGLGTFTVIVPSKPTTPCDFVFADDMKTIVMPEKYCVYTYQVIGATPEMKETLAGTVTKNIPNVDYTELFKKLQSIR